MGRRKRLIKFNNDLFIKQIKRLVYNASKSIANELIQQAKFNIYSIPFKKNDVKLMGGKVTSDAKRKKALIESIKMSRKEFISQEVLNIAVEAMGINFNDSFIGWYYEFGTGIHEEEDHPQYNSLEDPNPYRTSKQIVTRSTKVNGGLWRDAGGNLRVTTARVGGITNSKFKKYIGEDIVPHHWFREAVISSKPLIIKRVQEALSKVDLSRYFKIQKNYTLGRD